MPGLLRGVARTAVIAGTATSVSNRVSKRQGERWAEQEAPPQQPQQQQVVETPPPAAADYTAELEKLAELRDKGVISADDFEAKKNQLLGI
jgi:hypothetical protein